MESNNANELAIEEVHGPHMRMAQAHTIRDNRFKDRLQIRRGAADHIQHFSGGSLLLLRLTQLTGKARNVVFVIRD
jgi:hypothetical protein